MHPPLRDELHVPLARSLPREGDVITTREAAAGGREPIMNGTRCSIDEALLQRAYCEFLEMPGLRLTCLQAQRLWALDEWTCLQLLACLVETGFLCRSARGVYGRLSDGQQPCPLRTTAALRPHGKEDAV